MAKNYTETEVKLYVTDLAAVRARLEAAGGVLTAPRVFERNLRFDDDQGTLKAAGTVLRLRFDTRARLTYKDGEKLVGRHGTSRFEAEVEVGDFDAMQVILSRLGYTPILIYEKYRTTYTLLDAEVTLDEMPYGSFVEIEGDEDAIGAVVERLGLQGARRFNQSYSLLFATVCQNLGLSVDHLTFDNFAGISVPESAFRGAS